MSILIKKRDYRSRHRRPKAAAPDAAFAQKAGGIWKLGHFDSPASMPMLEESTQTWSVQTTIKSLLKNSIPLRFQRWAKTTYKRTRFFGFRYKCPFCKAFLRTFLPCGFKFPILRQLKVIGGGYRLNAECPVCGSFDRERLLFRYLLCKTDLFTKPHRLLHVAPEVPLVNIFSRQNNLDYVTADLLAPNVMVQIDLTDIPFPDDSFDAIICNHVLEHIIDDRKAMCELHRVLKSSGWAILQVPISLTLKSTYEDFSITTEKGREEAFGQCDHVRIYGKDYKTRLEQTGFKVDFFDWTAEPTNFGGYKNLFGLIEDERLYVTRKSPVPR